MKRVVLTLWVPLFFLAPPVTQPVDSQLQALIEQLGDIQSAVREQATKELIGRGTRARNSALIEASKSDNPEVSSRATMILGSLPWERPGDPPSVRTLLGRYSKLPPDQRPSVVVMLLQLPQNQGMDAIFRLLRDETDTRIRWTIVRMTRLSWMYPPERGNVEPLKARQKMAQALDTTADDTPILALAAAAWKDADKARSVALYVRAATSAEAVANGEDFGEIDLTFRLAAAGLWNARRFDDIAKLSRRKIDIVESDSVAGVPETVCDLFALHAKVGPLAGYDDDRRQYAAYLLRPPLLYAQSQLAKRQNRPVLALVLERLALYSGGDDADTHRTTAEFLQKNSWTQSTLRELHAFLTLQPADATPEDRMQTANARLMLGQIHGLREEHLQAASEIEKGLAILEQVPGVLTRTRGDGRTITGEDAKRDMQSTMHGHYLRDAIARDDQPEIAKQIKQLQSLSVEDPEVVQEMVAYLAKSGDVAAADKLFTPVEQRLRDNLKAENIGQHQNSLAWFLARSGRKLDEAMTLAKQAVAGDPDNAAFIDTLAEVYFQQGDQKTAIELETKALAAEPGRPELESQMRRFKRGKKD